MKVYFPVVFSIVAVALFSFFEIILLKKLHPTWWRRVWVRTTSYGVPLLGIVTLVTWSVGISSDDRMLMSIGAYGTASVIVTGICLMLSLPLSALIHAIDNLILRVGARRRGAVPGVPVEERRRVLKTAAAGFPILALTAGGAGVSSAFALPEFPEIRMRFKNLPRDLRGFRILQISDLHLGFILGIEHLRKIAELSARQHADLVLLTGDFCDDATVYLEALNIAAGIPSRCGVYASIGNHEYFRGIEIILQAYEHSTVPLLRDSGRLIATGATPLYLAGADDPKTLSKTADIFFKNTIDLALRDAPKDAFTVLMSHRPEGFNYASSIGIPLTLAGHTHGGQIGMLGRSIFERIMPEKYMWGLYERGDSKLYTSAGAGHWFPYRLGCHAEAPVYVLDN